MKVHILHPDLGIGGAERLIIDAALALKSKGHEVCIFTNHLDPNHCFNEIKDGTVESKVIGDWIPRNIFGSCSAIFAYLRMIYAAICLVFFNKQKPDVYICDQVSACVPVLKWGTRVIFYCHFPDQLLTERKNWLKRLYRFPIDWLEERTTGMADVVIVNSKFTAKVFKATFSSLKDLNVKIIHPTINMVSLLRPLPDVTLEVKTDASTIFLSINRYERKKNIVLAVDSLDLLRKKLSPKEFSKIHLIIAGGYDERVVENQEYYNELKNRITELSLEGCVSLLKSPSDDAKRMLFHCCTAVLYTPANEHFGIVPLEAMLLGRPVIACNSGGPLETVIHEQTGFLCEPAPEAFAEKMLELAKDRSWARELGTLASEHVRRKFSFQNFASQFNDIVENCS